LQAHQADALLGTGETVDDLVIERTMSRKSGFPVFPVAMLKRLLFEPAAQRDQNRPESSRATTGQPRASTSSASRPRPLGDRTLRRIGPGPHRAQTRPATFPHGLP